MSHPSGAANHKSEVKRIGIDVDLVKNGPMTGNATIPRIDIPITALRAQFRSFHSPKPMNAYATYAENQAKRTGYLPEWTTKRIQASECGPVVISSHMLLASPVKRNTGKKRLPRQPIQRNIQASSVTKVGLLGLDVILHGRITL
jgi:hypothetical protein